MMGKCEACRTGVIAALPGNGWQVRWGSTSTYEPVLLFIVNDRGDTCVHVARGASSDCTDDWGPCDLVPPGVPT